MDNFEIAWSQETYEHYTYGHCMHLAAALHRKLGWEIQLTQHPAEGQYAPYVEHAWLVDPSGTYCLDSDGLYPLERNGFIGAWSPLHIGLSEAELKDFTLLGSNPFSDTEWNESVERALEVAEAYFPLAELASALGKAGKVADATAHPPDKTLKGELVIFDASPSLG